MKHQRIAVPAEPNPVELGDARELRRFLRRRISATGWTRFSRSTFRLKLEDLSEQGCRFWIPRRKGLPLKSEIVLYIDELGPFKSTVRWSRDGWIGVEFDLPVYSPVFEHICTTRGGEG